MKQIERRLTRRGITLIEVLITLLILTTFTASAFTVPSEHKYDDHRRFARTKAKLDQLRTAILGNPNLLTNGQQLRQGFLVDMGRLPKDLCELVEAGDQPRWAYAPHADQWAGWRGPYLPPDDEHGTHVYRDGWGNESNDTRNFGWKVTFDADERQLSVATKGRDGVIDGGPGAKSEAYDKDFPSTGLDLLATEQDHCVNLKDWRVWVTFFNVDNKNVHLPSRLRLRVFYPKTDDNDQLAWPVATLPSGGDDRDEAAYLSLDVKLAGNSKIKPGQERRLKFEFTHNQVNVDKMVPAGLRTIVVIDDNNDETYNPGDLNTPFRIQFSPTTELPRSLPPDPLFTWNVTN
ncbi:MAG: hypothetical protein CMJ21_00630 [Phycisphaerae bacterium]|nr:hypothetical protein [Phycisphaerae bacterium]